MSVQDELILLDTSVLVHLIRDNQLGRDIAATFDLRTRHERPLISVVTVGEGLALAEKLGWGSTKRKALESLFQELVITDINSNVVLRRYSEIDAFLSQRGMTIGQNDIWIAATAAGTGAHLVTNDRHFDRLHPKFLQRTWVDPNASSLGDA